MNANLTDDTSPPYSMQTMRRDDSETTVWIDADLLEIIPEFINAQHRLVDELRRSAEQNERENICRISHRLAGAFGLYGFHWGAQLCKSMTNNVLSAKLEALQLDVEALDLYLRNVVMIPLHPTHRPTRDRAKSTNMSDKPKILIIDANSNAFAYMQNRIGCIYNLVFTSSAAMSLELAIQEQPDLVLCAVGMPEIGGGDLSSVFAECAKTKHIPFGYLTPVASPMEVRYLRDNVGERPVIAKSAPPPEMIEAIEDLLNREEARVRTHGGHGMHQSRKLFK